MMLLKNKTKLLIGAIVIATVQTSTVNASLFVLPNRCGHDQLEPAQAYGRNQWFKKCYPLHYGLFFPGGIETGGVDTTNAPQYPTYAVIKGNDSKGKMIFEGNGWRAPLVAPPTQNDPSCAIPEPNQFVGLCTASCATSDTELASPKGTKSFETMYENMIEEVLSPIISQNEKHDVTERKLRGYTRDMMDSSQEIFKITTENGTILKTSSHHPLLTSNRTMVRSKDIKVGQFLLTGNGTPTRVMSVEKELFFGKLYNATIDTNDRQKSLYIINNIISGDKKIQDETISEINRSIFRDIVNQEN